MHTIEATVYTAILITGTCISIIIFYFAVTLILQQKKYALLSSARLDDEITQLEDARKKIAEDLHDGFGPMLFAARMKFAAITTSDLKIQKLQSEGLLHLDKLMENLRDFTKELVPASLLNKGLVPALEEFFKTIQSSYDIELSFNVQDLPDLTHKKNIHIYRIVQEIIFNTVKHAIARCLTIEIFIRNNRLIVTTADDGKGFEYDEKTLTAGQGLQNMRNRVELLKGDFHIKTARDHGTCYNISLPCNELNV